MMCSYTFLVVNLKNPEFPEKNSPTEKEFSSQSGKYFPKFPPYFTKKL
jgi:hypothetical protein